MPAAVRGGPRAEAKPRAKAPLKPAPRSRGKAPGGRRGVRDGVGDHGPSPRLILAGAAGLLAIAFAGVLATGHRAESLAAGVRQAADGRLAEAGFRLRAVRIQGASPAAAADIVKAAGLYRNQPLLGLDLDGLKRKVETVGWVKDARVLRLLPDTLVISVVQRRQLAVWQHDGRTLVIDDHGQPIPEADPARFAGLPLVVGQGAAAAAPQILPMLAQRPRLMSRMEALVRVDDRRWDLRMKDGSLIQLSATGEEDALMQLEQLEERARVLELGFERIDLRNPDVVAVRPREPAPPGRAAPAGA